MDKIYGYARSNRGKDGVAFQVKQLERYARGNNSLLDMYLDVSSGTQVGSQLQSLLSNIPNDSKLVVVSKSRLSRNSNDVALILNELRSKNVELVVLNQGRCLY